MGKKLFDGEGNEIIEIDDDKIENLGDIISSASENAEAKEKLESLTKEHDSLKEKYKGLESKDFNFRAFEKASEEEKAKLTEKMSEIEKAAVEKIAEMSGELEKGKTEKIDGTKEKAIKALSNGDEDLKKELESAYEKSLEFGGKPENEEAVITRMQEAYRYVKGTTPPMNPLNGYQPSTPVFEQQRSEDFGDTEKGKKFMSEAFPHLYGDNK